MPSTPIRPGAASDRTARTTHPRASDGLCGHPAGPRHPARIRPVPADQEPPGCAMPQRGPGPRLHGPESEGSVALWAWGGTLPRLHAAPWGGARAAVAPVGRPGDSPAEALPTRRGRNDDPDGGSGSAQERALNQRLRACSIATRSGMALARPEGGYRPAGEPCPRGRSRAAQPRVIRARTSSFQRAWCSRAMATWPASTASRRKANQWWSRSPGATIQAILSSRPGMTGRP